jgi:hypothetical protein
MGCLSGISSLFPGVSGVSGVKVRSKKSGIKVRKFRAFSRSKSRIKILAFEREREKRQNSIKRRPKITRFEPRLLNTTKKLFPKDLPKENNPSPPEKMI